MWYHGITQSATLQCFNWWFHTWDMDNLSKLHTYTNSNFLKYVCSYFHNNMYKMTRINTSTKITFTYLDVLVAVYLPKIHSSSDTERHSRIPVNVARRVTNGSYIDVMLIFPSLCASIRPSVYGTCPGCYEKTSSGKLINLFKKFTKKITLPSRLLTSILNILCITYRKLNSHDLLHFSTHTRNSKKSSTLHPAWAEMFTKEFSQAKEFLNLLKRLSSDLIKLCKQRTKAGIKHFSPWSREQNKIMMSYLQKEKHSSWWRRTWWLRLDASNSTNWPECDTK